MLRTAARDETRRKTNLPFNARKFDLGTFGSNLGGGCAISTIDGMRWFQTNVLPLVEQAGLR